MKIRGGSSPPARTSNSRSFHEFQFRRRVNCHAFATAHRLPRRLQRGFRSLRLELRATRSEHREHAMPYIYEGMQLSTVNRRLEEGISPRGFRIALLHHTTDFGEYRWTVDTAEDLEFMRQVYSRFHGRDDFSWKEVLDVVHNEPQLMQINASVKHKTLKDLDPRAPGH